MRRTGRGRGDPGAEDDRAGRPRRGQLHDPEILAGGEVGILPPTQRLVEVLGPVHVSDRHHHNLELHVHDVGSAPFDVSGLRQCHQAGPVPLGLVLTSALAPPIIEVRNAPRITRRRWLVDRCARATRSAAVVVPVPTGRRAVPACGGIMRQPATPMHGGMTCRTRRRRPGRAREALPSGPGRDGGEVAGHGGVARAGQAAGHWRSARPLPSPGPQFHDRGGFYALCVKNPPRSSGISTYEQDQTRMVRKRRLDALSARTPDRAVHAWRRWPWPGRACLLAGDSAGARGIGGRAALRMSSRSFATKLPAVL